MRTPSFRHMGGKARLRKWLVDQFPKEGGRYIEPFAGKGNVYFYARQQLNFGEWWLNDLDIGFLQALTFAELDQLPEDVTKEDFNYWRSHPSPIAKLLEPRITFAGKGYPAGFSGSSGTHVGYSRKSYLPMCERAKELLRGTALVGTPWDEFVEWLDLTPGDFIYCDPPYLGTDACYENVDHKRLIYRLNELPCRWAISGYPSKMYDENLQYAYRDTYLRNSEIKSSNSGEYEGVIEVLWKNY